MKKIYSCFILFLLSYVLFAETSDYEIEQMKRVSQVINNPDYLVAPGDKYTLSYVLSSSEQPQIYQFIIDGHYNVNLLYFGSFNAKGYTYGELQSKVQELIIQEFPKSFPQVIITSTGEFSVYVEGETNVCQFVKVWGMTKLSDIIEVTKTNYSSLRSIEITNQNNEVKTYDLYQSKYCADVLQDPFLQNNDRVSFKRRYGQVKITGSVYKPGAYEILENDTLGSIAELYGGFLPLGDQSRIRVKRYLSQNNRYGETIYLQRSEIEDFILSDMDEIYVPPISNYQPLVYFQGALDKDDVSNKLSMKITDGDMLSSVARSIKGKFTISSDLENALLSREGLDKPIKVNLSELLTQEDSGQDILLQDGDTIVIPFRQYKVFVTGQVTKPGAYPYIANRTWEYYIGLAGGFKRQNHIGKKVRIRDVYGEKHKQSERIIQPEDVIYAPLNHPMYYVKEYGGDIALITTTIISAATLCYTIDQLSNGDIDGIVKDN